MASKLSKHHAIRRAVLDEEIPAFLVDAGAWLAKQAARPLALAIGE